MPSAVSAKIAESVSSVLRMKATIRTSREGLDRHPTQDEEKGSRPIGGCPRLAPLRPAPGLEIAAGEAFIGEEVCA